MTRDNDRSLTRTDAALLRLRRFWDVPASRPAGAESPDEHVELSTVLVVEAVGRGGEQASNAGEGDGDVTVGTVAAAVGVAASTASRLVERAIAAGAVRRRPSTTDARRAALTLTTAGEELRARSQHFRVNRLAELVQDWPATDRETFATLLERFADEVARERAR